MHRKNYSLAVRKPSTNSFIPNTVGLATVLRSVLGARAYKGPFWPFPAF